MTQKKPDGNDFEKLMLQSFEQKHPSFVDSLLSMMGKLANADGNVCHREADFVENFVKQKLDFLRTSKQKTTKIINESKTCNKSYEQLAEELYITSQHQPRLHKEIIDLLFQLAQTDNIFHPEEERMIHQTVQIFDIEESFFQERKKHYFPTDL